jgi:hypothetical protein
MLGGGTIGSGASPLLEEVLLAAMGLLRLVKVLKT